MAVEVGADLEVSARLTIPASELQWRFSRSSGPGGQHVNTSDSRVQLTWSVAESAALTDDQRERLLQRLELGTQRTVDAGAGLVARPEVVAEGLDHVIGRDADVRRPGLEHLQHRVEHAGCRAERLPVGPATAPAAVEVAEELVCPVDEVDDHRPRMAEFCR